MFCRSRSHSLRCAFLAFACLLNILITNAQRTPVIELMRPTLSTDSVVHTTEARIAVGGRVLSNSAVMFLKVNKADVVVKENGLFLHQLDLQPGENQVRVGVANRDGQKRFVDFVVVRDVPIAPPVIGSEPPLQAPPIASDPVDKGGALPPQAPTAKTPVVPEPYEGDEPTGAPAVPLEIRALIIGVGKHQFGADKNLQYPAKDAAAFYDFITSPEGLAADPKNVRVLVDENATREAILGAMRDMMNSGNRSDVFFLYFSGHGQAVDNGQEYYFFTHDTRSEDQDAIVRTALSRSEVRARLSNGKVRKKVLFLDACYSGMMASGGKGMGERREHLFQEMAGTDEALVVFTSSSDTEQSFEDEDLDGGHGIFTYYVVKGLQGEADKARAGNNNGKVTVYELDEYLGDEVNARALRTKDQPQRPKRDCMGCDDFPLSVTTDYDISTAKPRPVQEVEWTTPPPKVEGRPAPTPANSPSGRTYEMYKLPPVPKDTYTEPANPRFLNAQVYANISTGDKITFDGHNYAHIVVTGWLGGHVLSGPGLIQGIQVAFTDEATTDRMKKGFAVFSPDSSSLNVTLELLNGTKEKYVLQRMGLAKREPLQQRVFTDANGRTELCVYGVNYSHIVVSGHVNGTIIDATGLISGDVLMFADERKDAYASGQLVLSDDWSSTQGVITFGNGARETVRLERSFKGPGYEINKGIYTNTAGDQTISFDGRNYAHIGLTGIVGEENIQCAGLIKGDVISVNDEPNNPTYLPSKLVLRDKGRVLEGEVIFKDRTVVRVNMERKK